MTELNREPDSSRQGQAQEFGIKTLVYGLWTSSEDDSELATRPLSQRLFKHFFDNVLIEHVGFIHVSPLTVHLFCSEQVEGVILSHFYSLGFIIRDLLKA